jgi:hypothetical protein
MKMTPPKCRICGVREHNHRCQGGAPAMRIEERARVRAAPSPRSIEQQIVDKADRAAKERRRWHDDTDSAGEPTEIRDPTTRPARFYAPPGQCVYCDRRRDAARRSMASVRERGTDA